MSEPNTGDAIDIVEGKAVLMRNLRYTENHLWFRQLQEGLFQVGLTQPKVIGRGKILFVEFLVKPGERVQNGTELFEVETQKSIIAIESPVNGIVERVNEEIVNHLDAVRRKTYQSGWLLVFREETPGLVLNSTLDVSDYYRVMEEELGGRLGMIKEMLET